MTEVVGREDSPAAQVVIGVDTHQDQHVAVAIDRQGVCLAERHAPATTCGYGELERWSRSLGKIRAFGIEGHGLLRRRIRPIPDRPGLYRRRGQPA